MPAPVPAETLDRESCRVPVYKRDAIDIVQQWLDLDREQVRAWEDRGRCFLEYPGNTPGELLQTTAGDWWGVLRLIQSDLIRCGKLPNPVN